MEYYKIDPTTADRYSVFDPFGWMQWLALPNVFAIGAIDKEADRTVGIMVCMYEEDVLTILWLAVASYYQGQGYGEQLLRRAFALMDGGKIPRMRVIIEESYELETFSMKRESYFTERLFGVGDSAAISWSGTLFELSQVAFYDEPKNEKLKPVSLANISGHQFNEVVSDFMESGDAKMIYNISTAKELLDPELSCILTIKNEPCGAFFVQRLSQGTLLPVFIYAESGREADAMLRFAYDRAMAIYGETAQMTAALWDIPGPAKQTQTEKLLTKLAARALPHGQGGVRILSVSLEEYHNFVREYHPEELDLSL